ncbi:hypothetical protein QTO34_014573 [Cnephaeus nilssonii]|uniref:Disks large homologue 1 N-terminal PEST domain-containing protein n=1 Tax=Cnephaeus nilssonii TaxID=3371016 RepID=A0AA40I7L4_CNENI|nr:hypothetical protein QTO34_014573 [Eptesicus nilssonii]
MPAAGASTGRDCGAQEQRIFSNHQRLTPMTATGAPPWSDVPAHHLAVAKVPAMFRALLPAADTHHVPHAPPSAQASAGPGYLSLGQPWAAGHPPSEACLRLGLALGAEETGRRHLVAVGASIFEDHSTIYCLAKRIERETDQATKFVVGKLRLASHMRLFGPLSKYRYRDEDTPPQEHISPQIANEVIGPELVHISEKNLSEIENVHGFVSHSHISPIKFLPIIHHSAAGREVRLLGNHLQGCRDELHFREQHTSGEHYSATAGLTADKRSSGGGSLSCFNGSAKDVQ